MDKLKFLILTLTFCELLLDLEARARHCPKGQRFTLKGECEICAEGYYELDEICEPCTTCETDRGSFTKKSCTKEKDTECECHEGFAPWGDDTSTCKCEPGFGLHEGKCQKCGNGYFNKDINRSCQKWTECKYGVKTNGTTTSDVVCKSNPDITTPNTACSTSNCRREGIQTQNRDTTTTISSSSTISSTTTTTAPPGHTVTTKRELEPFTPNTSNYAGLVLLLFGIGALIILTAVTCKLHITPCVRNPSLPSKDSMCRRPVEEIGDGSLSSLKLNPEP